MYTRFAVSPALREKITNILACIFQVIVVATEEIKQGRFKSYFRRLIGAESPVSAYVGRLDILTLDEERLVLAETYGGVKEVNEKTDRVEDLVMAVNENLQSLSLDHLGQMDVSRREKLRDILQPSPYPKDFYTAFERSRVSGTGNWILQDESLNSWLKGDKPFLWMNGSPGTGKSFLTSHIVTWGTEHLPRIAYFFFRDTGPETRSVVQALHDLAYQISEVDDSYSKTLMSNLYSIDDIRTVSSAYRKLFLEPLQTEEAGVPTYLFLDGIDEADAEEMSQLLTQIGPREDDPDAGPRLDSLHVAFVGRSYMTDRVVQTLDRDTTGDLLITISITPDRSTADVSAYIARGVLQCRILNQTSPEFKERVVRLMEKKVDGLFILAKFMLAEVNRKRHPRSILRSLEAYPKEIDGMLEKTLESLSIAISEEEAEDLNEMLRWIICAEQALTLEQLEAALILHFGDPPFRLEETIRGQYACFFELEREDGLTTDDLIKDNERRRSEARQTGSPHSKFSPTARFSGGDSAISDRALSPLRQTDTGRKSSISSIVSLKRRRGSGGSRQGSPVLSNDLALAHNEMEFRSKRSTTVVTFFHTTIREFFLNLSTTEIRHKLRSSIHFHPVEARLHVLKTCLRIFTDREWFESYNLGTGQKAMKQYAGWYWQEHMACLDPSTISAEEKRELGVMIYRMLTDEALILDWTIMYKKSDEGLMVLMERNLKSLLRWFEDPEVVAGLDGAGQAFAASLNGQPSVLCEAIGRFYAKCWLGEDSPIYMPTVFCFDIVQSVALRAAGYAWQDEGDHWLEVDLDTRITKSIEWANYRQSGHWNRRIGSTYLTLGRHNQALAFFEQALLFDGDKEQCLGRIGWCLFLDGRAAEALGPVMDAVNIEELNLAEQRYSGARMERCKWRLYKNYYLAAQCYHATYQTQMAMKYFNKAIRASTSVVLNQNELFESEISYLEALSDENLFHDMMAVLQDMSLAVTKKTKGPSRLIELMLNQNNKRLVLDQIPKAASKTNKTSFMLEVLGDAIAAAHDMREEVVMLYLRLAYGTLCVHSYRLTDAMTVFEQISLVEARARGNVVTRQGHAIAFQKLASLYKGQLLHNGITSSVAATWIGKLEGVMVRQDEQRNSDMPANVQGFDVNTAAIYLGLYYRLLGRREESRELLGLLIRENLALLSDAEPLNDEFALDNLLWLLLAAGDVEKARSLAWSMRNVNPNISLQSTQSDSPVLERPEPQLMNIQSTDRCCAQCLEDIPATDEFSICTLCMESYCHRCLHKVICVRGNSTADRRTGVQCRRDHVWFVVPTLNRSLHHGQIMSDKGVREFGSWTEEVKADWVS